MAHKSTTELRQILAGAAAQVTIGALYAHYKHPDQYYRIADIVLIEATDEPGVVYEALYDDLNGVKFLRPISDFLAEVEMDGEKVKRFSKLV
jgi:hypothetical protein